MGPTLYHCSTCTSVCCYIMMCLSPTQLLFQLALLASTTISALEGLSISPQSSTRYEPFLDTTHPLVLSAETSPEPEHNTRGTLLDIHQCFFPSSAVLIAVINLISRASSVTDGKAVALYSSKERRVLVRFEPKCRPRHARDPNFHEWSIGFPRPPGAFN